MKKIGITGGIGSGKSTICKIFEVLGIPIYYADDRAKWLMKNDPELVKGITKLIGKKAYKKSGKLNRKYIAKIIFNDKEKLEKMNALVHPAVWMDGEKWNQENEQEVYTLKEAALLFESGGYQLMDKMITVYAPQDIRLERVMQRDDANLEEVKARMDKQMAEEKKIELADYVIHNYGNHSLIQQVLQIHKELSILDV